MLKQNKKIYECPQDTIRRFDTTRYNSPYIYYASPPIQVNGNDEFLISANLPNGKVLSGYTRVPHPFEPTFSYPFNSGITTRINRSLWGNSWQITWETYGNDLYFPKLIILYEKKNDSSFTPGVKEIPVKYINQNGSIEGIYPDYISGNSITYEFDAIDSAMAQISEGDPDKRSYRIISIVFEMLEFDPELSKYYASTHGYLDNFSIRLDETTYSNIEGGIGIIGSKLQTNLRFEVNHTYISLFGYSQ
jgi:hypothetical protein